MEKKNDVGKKEKKVRKEIKKEIKKVTKKVTKPIIKKEPKKVVETPVKVEEDQTEPFLVDIKKIKNEKRRKYLSCLELIVIVVVSMILLLLLCNRTFFRHNYKNSKINIDIPLLMFFKSDKDNKLIMNTLRNEKYVKDFFDDKLSYMKKYNCDGFSFHYDELNHVAYYDIKINRTFFVKEVTINYAVGNADCLCGVAKTGIEAEKLCKK